MTAIRPLAGLAMFIATVSVGTPALSSDASDSEAVVSKWIGDFNSGNFKNFIAKCAPRAAVVDGFPPYAWTNCAAWMRDYQVNNKAIGATHGTLTIGKLSWSEIKTDFAYYVYPVTFADTQQGKPVSYKGSWAITLHKQNGQWMVTGSGSAWGETDL